MSSACAVNKFMSPLENKKIIRYSVLIPLFATIMLVGAAGYGIKSYPNIFAQQGAEPVTLSGRDSIPTIVERVTPAVVSIVGTRTLSVTDPFSGRTISRKQTSGGSGFFVSSDGLIVTNAHVIDTAGIDYQVFTSNGTQYEMEVVDTDPVLDLAIIRIRGGPFSYLQFADSDRIRIGETAIAIGNALGEFENSVSVGVISGVSRSITAGDRSGRTEQLDELIQTDAAINPGNSGGPLLNLDGRVVGVNIATVQGYENISFAIPSNAVQKVVQSVAETGRISRAFLGVRYIPVTSILSETEDLPVDYGALITGGSGTDEPAVEPGSSAEKAGLKAGDIITAVDGISLRTRTLASILRGYEPGKNVTITVIRDGQTLELGAELGSG